MTFKANILSPLLPLSSCDVHRHINVVFAQPETSSGNKFQKRMDTRAINVIKLNFEEQLTNINYDFFTHLLKFLSQLLQWLSRLAFNDVFSHRRLKGQ